MIRYLILLAALLPVSCFAQLTISGRILNAAGGKPIGNASVFLSNTTIGDKTTNEGTFILNNLKSGKYSIVISIIGFETHIASINLTNENINLGDITLQPKTIALKEVKIRFHEDPDREKYYQWFKDEFLGTSDLSNQCKILNSEILDFDYDKKTGTLTASASEFLDIENNALGYKIKYLLKEFKASNRGENNAKIHYDGLAFFEEMKDAPLQEKYWRKQRQQDYEGSPMHFFRSVLDDSPAPSSSSHFFEEGFWVMRFAQYPNPDRPDDSLISAKIKFFKTLRANGILMQDSLSWWDKKARLPKTLDKLMQEPLQKSDFVKPTDQKNIFALALTRNTYSLFINFDKDRLKKFRNGDFKLNVRATDNLSDTRNTENTIISFNNRYALFDSNGIVVNPGSLTYSGVWGKRRIAELLPSDYVPHPDDNKPGDNIISLLNDFDANHVTEKAYLQFDKPFYAAGDTIYFKAYVTAGEKHLLSNLSGVLHVDLINTNNKIDQSIKLHLDSGIAWGDFSLPDSLPAGKYRVRAYTQLMRNEGDIAFFNKLINIGSAQKNKITESGSVTMAPSRNKPDIQFLPEGGNLVAGTKSKIAFKAVGTNGLGIDVKGEVIDDENKSVCSFASSHLGMGYFNLNPEANKKYRAKVFYEDGARDTLNLPQALPNGINLSINNQSLLKARVGIQASTAYYLANKNKDFTIIMSAGGVNKKINFALDSAMIGFDILTDHFRSGIATVTLFSPKSEVLCERLFFIQNNDQLQLSVTGPKSESKTREAVQFNLKNVSELGKSGTGHFSVSVIDEKTVPFDGNEEITILNNLLLTSDLKGYIEQPNYYFTDTSLTVLQDLDVLMLTQGYRKFEWKKILDKNYPAPIYRPEQGLAISGTIKSVWGKPLKAGNVNLIPQAGGSILSTVSDEKGVFHFNNLFFTDTGRFVLNAVKADGKNSTKITCSLDEDAPAVNHDQLNNIKVVNDSVMSLYVANFKNNRNFLMNNVKVKGVLLKEVDIKDKKLKDNYRTLSIAGAGNADQVMHAEEIEQIQGQLVTSLNGRLHGITFIGDPYKIPFLTSKLYGSTGRPKPMLVVIDGVEVGAASINYYTPNDIETVEVLKYASAAAYGMQGANGVLVITTKPRGEVNLKDIVSIGVLPIAPIGFNKAREFYSPKYDIARSSTKQQDLRSTIYWQPELKTDKDGNASFEFYNADTPGTYKVVVEGIDETGNLGRQVYRYKVQ